MTAVEHFDEKIVTNLSPQTPTQEFLKNAAILTAVASAS